jgi:ectoine hydroxylase-related dioxygenase (phytanoyl-CoA dioxygenase family)
MTTLTRLPADATVDDVVAAVRADGGVIVEDFLPSRVVDELRNELLPKIAQVSTGVEDFSGFKTRRMAALFAHSRRVADVALHPLFHDAAEELVNVPVEYLQGFHTVKPGLRIGATQLIQIGPGEGAQPLHRDDWSFLWRHPAYGREARLQIMVALSEFTAANGGTMVVPRSHLWDDDRIPTLEEAVPTEMQPGSALLWLGSTYHGGGTNTTRDVLRTGLTMALDAANVRQEENMYLALSPEVVRSYPERVQALLGWSMSEGNYMGWVEIDGKMANPIALLGADG